MDDYFGRNENIENGKPGSEIVNSESADRENAVSENVSSENSVNENVNGENAVNVNVNSEKVFNGEVNSDNMKNGSMDSTAAAGENNGQNNANATYSFKFDQIKQDSDYVLNDNDVSESKTRINGETFKMPESPKEEKKNQKKHTHPLAKRIVAVVSSAALFGVIAGAAFQGTQWYEKKNSSSSMSATEISETGNSDDYQIKVNSSDTTDASSASATAATASSADVSTVVANVMPSVVAITCQITQETQTMFGTYEQQGTGAGTGIIIGQDAGELLIVTNNHVIEDASSVEVTFADESTATAAIKGTDPSNDIALLSIDMDDLTDDTKGKIEIATIGDSDTAEMGDMVIAIGNALGYGQSVTVGYISALNREVTVDDVTLKLIQTDAAINPGNSGGPLVNTKGEIIGINSVKYSSTEVEGIGYSIPMATVVPIVNELMNREELTEDEQGYIGIVGKDITEDYAAAFNLPEGIYVSEIKDDSPAADSDLNVGDIIVGINETAVSDMEALQQVLSYTKAGTKVTLQLKVLDNGEYVDKEINVTLGNRPES